jgi:hypothetical protein
MAAPARNNIPPKAPAKAPQKTGAAKAGAAKPGKGRPLDADDAPPPAPVATGLSHRLKLLLIVGGGLALVLASAAATYVLFFDEPKLTAPTIDEVAPPTPAPRPAQIGPVRQGDLNDELWRRMGVRPEGP